MCVTVSPRTGPRPQNAVRLHGGACARHKIIPTVAIIQTIQIVYYTIVQSNSYGGHVHASLYNSRVGLGNPISPLASGAHPTSGD